MGAPAAAALLHLARGRSRSLQQDALLIGKLMLRSSSSHIEIGTSAAAAREKILLISLMPDTVHSASTLASEVVATAPRLTPPVQLDAIG